MRHVFLWGEQLPIHSVTVGNLPRGSRSARNASAILVAYAHIMALMLPTSLSFFYAGNAINLVLPTNLLKMDGLRRGGRRF
jgi:hypothetical protein